jgi:hypothetical protein
MTIGVSHNRPPQQKEATNKEGYSPVERTTLLDGLRDRLLIRSSSGSELMLQGCRAGSTGEYLTTAKVTMAAGTEWHVKKVTSGDAEALFRRDTKVTVGEPFGLLIHYLREDRRIWVNLGTVTEICVTRP